MQLLDSPDGNLRYIPAASLPAPSFQFNGTCATQHLYKLTAADLGGLIQANGLAHGFMTNVSGRELVGENGGSLVWLCCTFCNLLVALTSMRVKLNRYFVVVCMLLCCLYCSPVAGRQCKRWHSLLRTADTGCSQGLQCQCFKRQGVRAVLGQQRKQRWHRYGTKL